MDFFHLLKFKRNRRAEHEYMNKHMMVMYNSQTKMQDPLKDKALYAPNVITGHNRTRCTFATCISAAICGDTKRHPNENKYLKDQKGGLKKLK